MAIEAPARETKTRPSRVCQVTGLTLDRSAETLVKLNAVTAVVFLLLGAIAAILLGLTRWQAVHLLDANWYYRLVTFHGINMLVFWIVFFEMAGLVFASTVVLSSRQVLPKLAYAAYALMLAGTLLVNGVVLFGPFDQASVMFTAYPPLKSHPLFYLGLILFAVGALLVCLLFFLNVVEARRSGASTGPLPLFTYGLGAAATIAVFTLVHGAITMIPAFLWSVGLIDAVDPAVYRLTFWGFGHPAQQVNLCAMVAIWYLLSTLTVGGKAVNEKVSRTAFLLYVLFINLGSAHHVLVDPGFSGAWKIFNTSYAMSRAVFASLVHALSIPASVEVAQRRSGFGAGFFQWLRKAPWKNPAFSAMALSLAIFGFLGGVSGVIIGTEQVNLRVHNTLRVPGHFHSTVVGGTTLAFMGLTYYVIPLVFRREWWSARLARVQPWLFAAGITVLSISMTGLGALGHPRRHWDVTFAGSVLPATLLDSTARALQAGLGIGGVVAFLGVLIFAANAVATLLLGKRVEGRPAFPPIAPLAPAADTAAAGEHRRFPAPGVLVLVVLFLVFFIAVYAANWFALSKAWGIG
ncbi:MAG: cbb3-type cytochrome c oxidase subunit I [Planctomycetes bacterium]|nr:cbb3-type cytochrome c oxidase subunit I [Planctomycetota bacterium]